MTRRDDRNFVLAIVTGIVVVGATIALLSIVGMRMAYRRAYAEVATHCRRVSLLTVDDARFFCAPVVRVEAATSAASQSPGPATQL